MATVTAMATSLTHSVSAATLWRSTQTVTGIRDDIDPCVGELDACGVCNGPGAIYECGCSDIPEGDRDCNGNVPTNAHLRWRRYPRQGLRPQWADSALTHSVSAAALEADADSATDS